MVFLRELAPCYQAHEASSRYEQSRACSSLVQLHSKDCLRVNEGGKCRTCTKTMRSHVDDVVGAGHHMNVSIGINHTRVSSVNPLPLESLQISLIEPVFIIPKRAETSRSQRLFFLLVNKLLKESSTSPLQAQCCPSFLFQPPFPDHPQHARRILAWPCRRFLV